MTIKGLSDKSRNMLENQFFFKRNNKGSRVGYIMNTERALPVIKNQLLSQGNSHLGTYLLTAETGDALLGIDNR